MRFQIAGLAVMAIMLLLAVATLSISVWRRAWSIWLLGYALLCLAVIAAWHYRDRTARSAATTVERTV